MSDLTTAARLAGLRDPDLLQLAKPDIPPREAVADLQRRYPRAFAANDASAPEWRRPVHRPVPAKPIAEMTPNEVDAFERRLVNHSAVAPRIAAERVRFARITGGE